jgi:hypothetical protein
MKIRLLAGNALVALGFMGLVAWQQGSAQTKMSGPEYQKMAGLVGGWTSGRFGRPTTTRWI